MISPYAYRRSLLQVLFNGGKYRDGSPEACSCLCFLKYRSIQFFVENHLNNISISITTKIFSM